MQIHVELKVDRLAGHTVGNINSDGAGNVVSSWAMATGKMPRSSQVGGKKSDFGVISSDRKRKRATGKFVRLVRTTVIYSSSSKKAASGDDSDAAGAGQTTLATAAASAKYVKKGGAENNGEPQQTNSKFASTSAGCRNVANRDCGTQPHTTTST
jgi:hypothetical protein